MNRILIILAALLFMASLCRAEGKLHLNDKKAKVSYSLGYEFGSNLRSQEVALDEQTLMAAIREALQGKEPAMRIEDIRETLKQLRKEVLIRYNLRRNEFSEKNRKTGEAFLAANGKKEGVKVLPSGLQYLVLKEGRGPAPIWSDSVKVSYRGTLVNGTEFDSSAGRGNEEIFRVNGVIKGWTEALQLMKTGSKWRLFVPAELAYGGRQHGRIPPNSTLIFDLELLSIEKEPAPGIEGMNSAVNNEWSPAVGKNALSGLED